MLFHKFFCGQILLWFMKSASKISSNIWAFFEWGLVFQNVITATKKNRDRKGPLNSLSTVETSNPFRTADLYFCDLDWSRADLNLSDHTKHGLIQSEYHYKSSDLYAMFPLLFWLQFVGKFVIYLYMLNNLVRFRWNHEKPG